VDFTPLLSFCAAVIVAIITSAVALKVAQVQRDAQIEAAKQQAVPPALASASSQMLRELLDRTHEDLTEVDEERRECERQLLAASTERYKLAIDLSRVTEQLEVAKAERDAARDAEARMRTEHDRLLETIRQDRDALLLDVISAAAYRRDLCRRALKINRQLEECRVEVNRLRQLIGLRDRRTARMEPIDSLSFDDDDGSSGEPSD